MKDESKNVAELTGSLSFLYKKNVSPEYFIIILSMQIHNFENT